MPDSGDATFNIVLCLPPAPGKEWNQGAFPPLGLLYLAAAVRDIPSVRVHLVDGCGAGLSLAETARRVIDRRPDLLGVSITSEDFPEGMEILRLAKLALPRLTTLCGGIHAGLFDDLLLAQCPQLDLVLKGEADQSFPELVRRLLSGASLEGLPGLSLRVGGQVARGRSQIVEDLDRLPIPARDLLEFRGYGSRWYGFDLPHLPRLATLFSSRGCPHHCTFCSDVSLGARYRARSAEHVMHELTRLHEQGYNLVVCFDDNLTGDVARIDRLCRLILRSGLRLALASTGMPYRLPEQTLRLMKRAGFFLMFVGVESGSDTVLGHYRKAAKSREMAQGILRAQRAGLMVIASFISGHPQESWADHAATLAFLRATQPLFAEINPLMVHPGSRLWDELHQGQPPKSLEQTRSRLISRYPQQQAKSTIEERLAQFRRVYQSQWRHPGQWLRLLRGLASQPVLRQALWGTLKKPRPQLLRQLLKGGAPR